MRVLVVDDDPLAQKVLCAYLTRWGYPHRVVGDGEAAWQLLQQEDFPVVISDWHMPGCDGLELMRRIQNSIHRFGQVYTILLTARSEKEDLISAMEIGVDDFLSKPFDRDELRIRLQEGIKSVLWDRQMAVDAATIVARLEAIQAELDAHLPAGESPSTPWPALRTALGEVCELSRRLAQEVRPEGGPLPRS